MKSLLTLLQVILDDIEYRCRVSTQLDRKTIEQRVKDEGISFLTISLSNYGSDLQKGLDRGYVDHTLFKGFSFQRALPRLFGGLLDLVFDRGTGCLLPEPSIDAIRCLRQISLMWAKIALPCTQPRVLAAIDKYMECESDVRTSDATLANQPVYRDAFARVSRTLFARVLSAIDLTVYREELWPKHGPGVVADRLFGNAKWGNSVWTDRLEGVFPSWRYSRTSFGDFLRNPVRHLDPGSEIPVKVITVPKTLKTPRIIAVEPAHMQYMQQALLFEFAEAFKKDKVLSRLIDFSTQVPNQELAREGSRNGNLATLDLSEASDRVSNQHVRLMLQNHPWLAEGVDACRSRKADVPGYGVIRLAKFASMGSALCFPFESMVFCTVIFMGIERELKHQLTRKDVKSLLGQVRIYGDDIIVPVKYANSVRDMLETFGFRVNAGKSYWNGKFRESCGLDVYDGHDVTCVRVRTMLPTRKGHAEEIISTVSLRNQLYKAGYYKSADHLDAVIERLIPFPAVSDESPALGKFTYGSIDIERWDERLQRPLVKAAVVSVRPRSSQIDDYAALRKFFFKRGDLPIFDKKHLLYAGRPVAVDIKHRWVSPL
jgi:hypothetical protein